MHRHLLALAALLAVASCANHLPDQDLRILTAQPAAKLAASDLWKDFQADAAAAKSRYFGKAVDISDAPTAIEPNAPAGSRMIFLQAGERGVVARLLDERATATVAEAKAGYSITHSPTVVKDKVIIGTGGGDGPIRGYISAFNAKSGEEVWRFYTIPGPGEKGNETWSGDSWKVGGVGVWNAGAYDPETNLVYFGTGNPAPDWDGSSRLGDNLYSDSVVALDADTGKLKWHYQFTPHDELDYDSTQVPVLADIQWQGKPRKVMLWANRNGVMYVLDRATGEFLKGKPYVKANWLDGFDAKGRPNRVKFPTKEGTAIYPHVHGATNWAPPSFSPRTGLFYVATWENSGTFAKEGQFPGAIPGPNTRQTTMGATNIVPFYNNPETEAIGVVRAYDPQTLDYKWEFRLGDITWGGTLVTAGDVVFSGGRDGYFLALDAKTGALLWKANVGGQINAAAMSYAVNGKQYISINAGSAVFAYALP